DDVSKYYWDYFEKPKLEGIDLIISCGDLAPQYLSFLATYAKVPVLYVHGNHDACYDDTPPEGCECIDGKIYVYRGVRILGLGGSMKYNYGPYQYSDAEMKRRILKLKLKIRRKKGFDILVSHSPALGINDGDDIPHRGFIGLTELLIDYSPTLFLHGHVHLNYGRGVKREERYLDTRVINAYERYVFDVEIPEDPPKRGLFFRTPEGLPGRKDRKQEKHKLTTKVLERRAAKDAAERENFEKAAARQRRDNQ
ncbi:MAG: metallophosphoesterase family protein, partial [Eubacterium sp.]|nr:metallophosphoesterase family protein [Eubacterium sp.]